MKRVRQNSGSNPKFSFRFLTFLLGFFLVSCSNHKDAAKLDDKTINEIETAISQRFDELIRYASTGDINNALMMFDQSGAGSYIDGYTRYKSLQDVLDTYRANWTVAKQDFGNLATKVIVLSPEFALASSTSNVSWTDTSGISYKPREWSFTSIWVLKDGKWQIHSYHQQTSPSISEAAKTK